MRRLAESLRRQAMGVSTSGLLPNGAVLIGMSPSGLQIRLGGVASTFLARITEAGSSITATLLSSVTDSDTTFNVNPPGTVPVTPFDAVIDEEPIIVTATLGSTWTVTRDTDDPVAHDADAEIAIAATGYGFQEQREGVAGELVDHEGGLSGTPTSTPAYPLDPAATVAVDDLVDMWLAESRDHFLFQPKVNTAPDGAVVRITSLTPVSGKLLPGKVQTYDPQSLQQFDPVSGTPLYNSLGPSYVPPYFLANNLIDGTDCYVLQAFTLQSRVTTSVGKGLLTTWRYIAHFVAYHSDGLPIFVVDYAVSQLQVEGAAPTYHQATTNFVAGDGISVSLTEDPTNSRNTVEITNSRTDCCPALATESLIIWSQLIAAATTEYTYGIADTEENDLIYLTGLSAVALTSVRWTPTTGDEIEFERVETSANGDTYVCRIGAASVGGGDITFEVAANPSGWSFCGGGVLLRDVADQNPFRYDESNDVDDMEPYPPGASVLIGVATGVMDNVAPTGGYLSSAPGAGTTWDYLDGAGGEVAVGYVLNPIHTGGVAPFVNNGTPGPLSAMMSVLRQGLVVNNVDGGRF